ncbi:MarR family winged helix-turn-helix transcriptional regulator [uncultured Microbacterium sp.]|uniref:MarR family winged helix-turn-helix transcriptional regulator n=1 Tax=uncultured Microbacterium sp. TaxID=191216 RepID=UPI0035CB39CA
MSADVSAAHDGLITQLGRVAATVAAHYDASAAAVGLDSQQARLLFILVVKPVNMLGLTSSLNVPKSTMTGLVARMERSDLLERDPAAGDRRSLVATPTAAGRTRSREFERDLAGRVSALLAGLDQDEQHEVADLLSEVLTRVESRSLYPEGSV